MSTYLLTCQCGKQVPVEVGQAGERVTCSCGNELEVPTLRKLRHLPLAQPAATTKPTAANKWNPKKGFIAAALILAALLAAGAAWNRWKEPFVPQFDSVGRTKAVREGLAQMKPVEAWTLWVEVYRPMATTGFGVFQHPHTEAIESAIVQHRFLQKALLIAAAFCVLLSLAAAFWPRVDQHPRRSQ